MLSCPNCGQANPDGFRLCGMCGTALVPPPISRVERKVVSVLFCDLVGFTAQAEQLDPEDVEAMLGPYHAKVRDELVRFGGTVEKFIGDAVMALFGAPTAHEDDPERAIRAALAIRDHADADGLELRIGVTTGEAVVALDSKPDDGRGMASGDVVNTAARLQASAAVNGILADATTYRATRDAIEYEVARAVSAKGKRRPIEAWSPIAARSRVEQAMSLQALSKLVGRVREREVLRGALERTISERASQLITLVVVPGIGKSRLVTELWSLVDEHQELITWRRGRCLAYGDGIAFWALGEMVKAQAGVHETDRGADAARKLDDAVGAVVSDRRDREWITRSSAGTRRSGDRRLARHGPSR